MTAGEITASQGQRAPVIAADGMTTNPAYASVDVTANTQNPAYCLVPKSLMDRKHSVSDDAKSM